MCVSFSMAFHTTLSSGSLDTTLTVVNTNTGGGASGYGIGVNTYNTGILVKSTWGGGIYSEGSIVGVTGIGTASGSNVGLWGISSGTGIYGNSAVYADASATDQYGLASGVYANASSGGESGTSQGVFASGSTGGDNSTAFGVYATAGGYADNTTGYGIYADGYGTANSWSAYFPGNVFVGGYFDNSSDLMLKKNIRSLDGGLNKVMAMKPKVYEMKTDEYKEFLSLPSGDRFGLIAQELETVIPNLVHANTAPARLTPEERKNHVKKAGLKFKSVDYMGLIPVLIQAIQEQQAEIEALKKAK